MAHRKHPKGCPALAAADRETPNTGEPPAIGFAEARFDALLSAAVDGIIVIDRRGLVQRFNPAAENIFGRPAKDVLGKNVSMLMPDPFRAQHDDYIARYLATGEARIIGVGREVLGLRADGSTFPIELSVGHVRLTGDDQFVGIVRDISKRKLDEERLRQQDEVIRRSFEDAPLAAFTRDREGRFLSVNRAMCTLLGYDSEDLLAVPAIDVVHPADRPAAHDTAVRLERGELESDIHRRRLLRKDGSVVHCRLHLGVVHDEEGRPALEIAQIEDESEHRRLVEEANDLRERLAHVGRLGILGEMATGIAHEINQPLTAIANYAQACRYAIQGGTATDDDIIDMLEKITRGAKRAGEVIRRMRGLVRKRDSERENLDLNDLVSDVVRLAEVDARLREARIELKLANGSPQVLADGVQIQQVVLNLARNGMEAMIEMPRDEQILEISTAAGDGAAEVTVRDRGAGLPNGDAERVFDPFFTTKEEGMGMGLSLCRSIIESHGGRLWFTGNEGPGTTFHFSLPILEEAGHG